jgi:hypothetical protein
MVKTINQTNSLNSKELIHKCIQLGIPHHADGGSAPALGGDGTKSGVHTLPSGAEAGSSIGNTPAVSTM